MTDDDRLQLRSRLTVDDQLHLLDRGPGPTVAGRIVRETHDDPVDERLLRVHDPLHAVARLRALVDVKVDAVQPDLQRAQVGLGAAAQQQGRGVGELRVVDAPGRDEVDDVIRAFDARTQSREFPACSGYI